MIPSRSKSLRILSSTYGTGRLSANGEQLKQLLSNNNINILLLSKI